MENNFDKEFHTENCFEIDKDLEIHIINPKNKIHRLLAFQFKVISKNEYTSFLTPNIDYNKSKMYILTKKGIPIGYTYWNDFNIDLRCFRQLFIRKKYRRKGFGAILTEKTVGVECGKDKKFVVEAPNEKTMGILLKFGYVMRKNSDLIGIRCSFTS